MGEAEERTRERARERGVNMTRPQQRTSKPRQGKRDDTSSSRWRRSVLVAQPGEDVVSNEEMLPVVQRRPFAAGRVKSKHVQHEGSAKRGQEECHEKELPRSRGEEVLVPEGGAQLDAVLPCEERRHRQPGEIERPFGDEEQSEQ